MTAEPRSRVEPADFGATLLLAAIHGLKPAAQKTAILQARQLGNITDEQTEILIRELELAAE